MVRGLAGVLKEAPREHLRTILHDLRFAARMARRSPGLATTVDLTLVAACLVLAIVAATATFIPASRASRLDPLTAMRDE
jgi:ABC-type lipoprotein release transport system permease subunit